MTDIKHKSVSANPIDKSENESDSENEEGSVRKEIAAL